MHALYHSTPCKPFIHNEELSLRHNDLLTTTLADPSFSRFTVTVRASLLLHQGRNCVFSRPNSRSISSGLITSLRFLVRDEFGRGRKSPSWGRFNTASILAQATLSRYVVLLAGQIISSQTIHGHHQARVAPDNYLPRCCCTDWRFVPPARAPHATATTLLCRPGPCPSPLWNTMFTNHAYIFFFF